MPINSPITDGQVTNDIWLPTKLNAILLSVVSPESSRDPLSEFFY
jgi:hypothetical protein